MTVRLDQLLPRRENSAGSVAESSAQPSEPRAPWIDAVAGRSIQNPLVRFGLTEVAAARCFFIMIERALAARKRWAEGAAQINENNRTPDEEVFSTLTPPLREAANQVATWVDGDCRGDWGRAQRVLDRFWAKLSVERFESPDLMSLLLTAHEETLIEESGHQADAMFGWPSVRVNPSLLSDSALQAMESSQPQLFLSQLLPAQAMHPASGPKAANEVEIRLISIREMLRQYFEAYPDQYPLVLAAALKIPVEQVADRQLLQARISGELAHMGVWGFSLNLWQEALKHQSGGDVILVEQPYLWGAVPPQLEQRPWWSLSVRWSQQSLSRRLLAVLDMASQWSAG